jgi:hypothetical protein
MSELIESKLSALRLKQAVVGVATGSSMAVVFLVLALAAGMLLDWSLELPRAIRAIFLLSDLVGLAYVLARRAIYPVVYNADDETLALAVERFHPSFATRLIAAIQFSRAEAIPAGASPSLINAMIRQTEEMAQPIDFTALVTLDRLSKFAAIAVLLVLASVASALFAPHITMPLLKRALLFNVSLPTKTQLEPITGDAVMALGEPAPLSVKVSGIHPLHGTAEITYASGRRQTITVEPSKTDPDIYTGVLDAASEDFRYQIKVNDAHTDTFKVQVLPAPALSKLRIDQIYPDYTGMGTQQRAPDDLFILMGSKLQIAVTASQECRYAPGPDGVANHIHLYGVAAPQTDIPLSLDSANHRQLFATITLPNSTTGFSVHLINDQGVHSLQPAIHRIEMIPDRAPQIRIWRPDRKEILATAVSNPLIGFTANDDIGLGPVVLHFKTDGGTVQTVNIPYDHTDPATGKQRRTLKALYRWPLSKTPLPAGKATLEGSVLEYWLEASDNRTPTPNTAVTEHYQLRVVTPAEKQAELMARLNESLGSLSHLADDQSATAQELGAVLIDGSQK